MASNNGGESETLDEPMEITEEDSEFSTESISEVESHTRVLAYFSKPSVELMRDFFLTMRKDWRNGNYLDLLIRSGMIGIAMYIAILFWRVTG